MCDFFSTVRFRRQIKELTKRERDGYASVLADICNEFKGKTIEEIRISLDRILDADKFCLVKLRLKNSALHLSKKDGFRLLYLVRKDKPEVTFLYVYPKRGNKGELNVKNNDYLPFLEDYVNECLSLVKHDIQQELKELE